MAYIGGRKSCHGTLSANTPETVILELSTRYLTVINKGDTGMYVTTDKTEPEIGAPNTYFIPPMSSRMLYNDVLLPDPAQGVPPGTYEEYFSNTYTALPPSTVKLVSGGSVKFGVELS